MRPIAPDSVPGGFAPAPEVEEWIRAIVIADTGALVNPEHAHLQQASLGFLWTDRENSKKGRTVLGMCQAMPPTGDKWTAGRSIAQIEEWFGDLPDFLITLYAPACAEMDDASFLALIEHELYHAGQATDEYGAPKFSRATGDPEWTVRPHDVEEFTGVVRRYGAAAAGVEEMVRVANRGPEIAEAKIARACGNCLRLVG